MGAYNYTGVVLCYCCVYSLVIYFVSSIQLCTANLLHSTRISTECVVLVITVIYLYNCL